MQIIKDEFFKQRLAEILRYISKDSKMKASRFNKQLSKKLFTFLNMPYKFRQINRQVAVFNFLIFVIAFFAVYHCLRYLII